MQKDAAFYPSFPRDQGERASGTRRAYSIHLGISAQEMIVGGHTDPDAPENHLSTERKPVEGFATFKGFEGRFAWGIACLSLGSASA